MKLLIKAPSTKGFTLTEMMTVIGIILLVIAVIVPAGTRMRRATGFNDATGAILRQCELARQHTLTTGLITEVRFFSQAGKWVSLQTFVYRPGGEVAPLNNTERFPASISLEPSPGASPLFAELNHNTDENPSPTQGTSWRGLRFFPSGEALGASNTLLDPQTSFLTIVSNHDLDASRAVGAPMPADYVTIQITPATSRLTVYRP